MDSNRKTDRNRLLDKLYQKYGEEFNLSEFHESVKKRYKIHCTLQQMADELSVSVSTFQREFKVIHGESFFSFMRKYVISRSAELLKDSDLSITEIAAEIGYNNPSKFSKAFSEVYGMNPEQYRKSKTK